VDLLAYDHQADVRLIETIKLNRSKYKLWRANFIDMGAGASSTSTTAYVKVALLDAEEGDDLDAA
jgi:hypothetical protein